MLFCSWQFALSKSGVVLFVVGCIEINSRHCFQRNLPVNAMARVSHKLHAHSLSMVGRSVTCSIAEIASPSSALWLLKPMSSLIDLFLNCSWESPSPTHSLYSLFFVIQMSQDEEYAFSKGISSQILCKPNLEAVASKTVSYCILYKFASICFGKIPGTEQAHWGKTGSMFYGVWVFGNSIHALKIIRQG